jgi:hypothetical protein
MGEVFDSVERSHAIDHGDSNCIQTGVEKVGAVGRGAHPFLVNLCGVGSAGEVLGDGGEVGASLGAASGEVGLAGVLVLKWAGFVDHPLVVSAGGAGDCVVPVERRKIVRGSGLVGELDEGLLGGRRGGGRWGALGDDCGGCEGQSKQREEALRVAVIGVHALIGTPDSVGKLAAPIELSCFA